MQEQKTYNQMRRDFQENFFRILSPQLLVYESERKKKLLEIKIYIILAIVVEIFVVLYKPFFAFHAAIVLAIIVIYVYCEKKKNFENKVKEQIMPLVCTYFDDLVWKSGDYSFDDLVSPSCIFPTFNCGAYGDNFSGKYKNVSYEINEAIYINKIDSKHKNVVFKGAMVKLYMNKNFKGNTVIRPDSLLHIPPKLSLKHTTLEDVNFEKKYDVYTDDEVEARYLITPAFMERLNNMKLAFNAEKVYCAFYKKYLLIGLSVKKDLFSVCSLVKPVNDPKQFFVMFEEILSIVKLIDHFKLDQKTNL